MRLYYRIVQVATLIVLLWLVYDKLIARVYITPADCKRIDTMIADNFLSEEYKKLSITNRMIFDFMRWYCGNKDDPCTTCGSDSEEERK